MKLQHIFLLVGIVAITALALGVYQASSAPLPEGFPSPTPPGKIEVKQYPGYRRATYRYQGELSQAANQAFYPLYQHISSNEISMTAPVETRYPSSTLDQNDSLNQLGEAQVSFLYRNSAIYPSEVAQNIEVQDVPPMTVVSIGLQGKYSYQSYQESLQRLKDWLTDHPQYQVVGQPRRFFYDGPYTPDAIKRSEIQIPLQF
ncbi:MAG TPA: ABC transporter substrate-binding protein [Cyanothece sp. UBA12306]|nr:ABC transporter substrate-binding protein [Cyanothece sp. UBA12306]